MVPLGVKANSSTVPSPEMVLCSSTSDLKMIRNGIWRAENKVLCSLVYKYKSISVVVRSEDDSKRNLAEVKPKTRFFMNDE